MSFVIDEDEIRRILGKKIGNSYSVTALNLPVASTGESTGSFLRIGVSSTVSIESPSMSFETREKLLDIRRRIVESGAALMTTEQLDDEIRERKGGILGD